MSFIYKLNTNIVGRPASQLNWKFNELRSNIRIINKENRMINGKSLIGLLSACLRENDVVKCIIDNDEDEMKFKEIMNTIGVELGGV